MKRSFLILFMSLLSLNIGLFSSNTFAQPCASDDPTSPVGIVPTQETFPGGGPACEGGVRFNAPTSGTFTLFGDKEITFTFTDTDCGQVLEWSVSPGIEIDQIVVKGATEQNIYDYTGEDPRPDTDGNLHSPINESGKYADVSHIDVCFSFSLTLSKTAETYFTRTYDWEIDKKCKGPDTLMLTVGQTYNYPFCWSVDASYTDSDWEVQGTVKVKNESPINATITGISDLITPGNIAVTLNCEVAFPYVLAPGDSFECTYSQALPNGDPRTNTVTVTTTGVVKGGTADADIDFTNAVVTEVDECVEVIDDTDTTEVCYENLPYKKCYSQDIGPYEECGEFTFRNTASFTTNDTQTTGSDYCDVIVEVVDCDGGCTLTPGYWKTHSEHGPAPYDDTWAQLANGADTQFFLSGQTYYQVLWTPPSGGNVYYILARAYIAAELNFLNGASVPQAVQDAFDDATTFFNNFTPAQAAGLKGAAKNPYTSLATILDNYNNGLTGPGHCSEENEITVDKDGNNVEEENTVSTFSSAIPESYVLDQNYPNPFNPTTSISFGIPEGGFVSLKIYDLLGNEVAVLVEENMGAGTYNITFDAGKLTSGVYLYKLQTGNFMQTRKMVLLK